MDWPIETNININDFGNYPDIVCDICDDNLEELYSKYDKIICIAVLEHVYNPFNAVKNSPVFSLTYFHPPNIFSLMKQGTFVANASVNTLGEASA